MAGFAILFFTRKFLLQLVPKSPPAHERHIDQLGVLAFALAVSLVAGTVFGLSPAWLMSRFDLIEYDSAGGTRLQRPTGTRARQILVISELALCMVLMVAAGLLLRSFWDLFKVQRFQS
jgi:hypothetical protein